MAEKSGQAESEGGIGCLIGLVLVFGGLMWIHDFWGEREGTIRTEDCRARVVVKAGSSDTWFKKFTCTYGKTKSGRLMSGYCEAVDTRGGACDTVYFYQKEVPKFCRDPKFPYLGYDDMCHTEPQ